jgi:predicted ferric reductase
MTLRTMLIWAVVVAALVVPIAAAAFSPLLQWRGPIYIAAGFAGIVAMALMLLQPLLAARLLPGIMAQQSRRFHRGIGVVLILAVVAHVVGLWITSPPDVVDVLLLRSPTPFSLWGVAAMWALFAAGFVAALRRRFSLRVWRLVHTTLVVIVVTGTVVHALLIDGTMETVSKAVLGVILGVATLKAVSDLRCWRILRR